MSKSARRCGMDSTTPRGLPPAWADFLRAERVRLERPWPAPVGGHAGSAGGKSTPHSAGATTSPSLRTITWGWRHGPEVIDAANAAASRYGAGARSARLLHGSAPAHEALEERLAAWTGQPASLLFSSGYMANLGRDRGPRRAGGDVVFHDQRAHASIIDGAKLSGAAAVSFPHNDTERLDDLLRRTPARRRLVATESVFSMDGDLAPLEALSETALRHEALLVVDEAHAVGVFGGGLLAARGAGTGAVVVGTLSKALGSIGGFAAGDAALIDYLINRARTFIFDTALPPSAVAAASAALDIARAEPEARRARPGSERDAAGGADRPGLSALDVGVADRATDLGEAGGGARRRGAPAGAGDPWRGRCVLRRRREGRRASGSASPPPTTRDTSGRSSRRWRGGRRRVGEVVLVTGTDTGVGKTVAAAWLAWRASRAGSVALIKAAQTGANPKVDGDEAFYRAALAGVDAAIETMLAFPEPLAPSIAARRAGRRVDFEGLARRCADVAAAHDVTLVEGSGGLLVPLDDEHDFSDLAAQLGARLAVVVRPGLGTLNHTALTMEAAARRGLAVDALICSGSRAAAGGGRAREPALLPRAVRRGPADRAAARGGGRSEKAGKPGRPRRGRAAGVARRRLDRLARLGGALGGRGRRGLGFGAGE